MHPLEVYLQLLPLALSEGAAATGSVSGALALSQMLGQCGRILVHPMLLAPTQVLGRRGWVANRRVEVPTFRRVAGPGGLETILRFRQRCVLP